MRTARHDVVVRGLRPTPARTERRSARGASSVRARGRSASTSERRSSRSRPPSRCDRDGRPPSSAMILYHHIGGIPTARVPAGAGGPQTSRVGRPSARVTGSRGVEPQTRKPAPSSPATARGTTKSQTPRFRARGRASPTSRPCDELTRFVLGRAAHWATVSAPPGRRSREPSCSWVIDNTTRRPPTLPGCGSWVNVLSRGTGALRRGRLRS